jgi:hypothetical protein
MTQLREDLRTKLSRSTGLSEQLQATALHHQQKLKLLNNQLHKLQTLQVTAEVCQGVGSPLHLA